MTATESILLVEDDPGMRDTCADALEDIGYQVFTAADPSEAEPILLREVLDLVITDLRMPKGGGTAVVAMVRDYMPHVPVILITAFPSVKSAVAAMKTGVVDYLIKPFDIEQFSRAVEAALQQGRARDRTELIQRMARPDQEAPRIIGSSTVMRRLLADLRRVATMTGDVLIHGETGTGKELVARALHRFSTRAGGPFVAVNCASIPENLFESEIFGHEKGAFTDAIRAKPGLLEQADGGVLFLDEVGELPMTSQAKLLRAIDEKACRRVGGLESRNVDVRVVSATNRDLRKEMTEGRFREDMFYRLSPLEVRVPALRDRPGDVMQLAVHFLGEYQVPERTKIVGFSDGALSQLCNYPWPGNVRELQNAVYKILACANSSVVSEDDVERSGAIPTSSNGGLDGARKERLGTFDCDYLSTVLEEHDHNVTQTAKSLGIHRTTLQRLMRKYGLRRGGS